MRSRLNAIDMGLLKTGNLPYFDISVQENTTILKHLIRVGAAIRIIFNVVGFIICGVCIHTPF